MPAALQAARARALAERREARRQERDIARRREYVRRCRLQIEEKRRAEEEEAKRIEEEKRKKEVGAGRGRRGTREYGAGRALAEAWTVRSTPAGLRVLQPGAPAAFCVPPRSLMCPFSRSTRTTPSFEL